MVRSYNQCCSGNSVIPCSLPSNSEVINKITYTNHNQPYSLTDIILNISVKSQCQLTGNRIMQIICTNFKRNYIPTNLHAVNTIHINSYSNKRMFAHAFLYIYNLAKEIIMTGKSLHSFSVLVSAAVKHFTRSKGNN